LGALSGAVVLGPVGAVAGAVIGFTAGPAISHSWGTRGSEPQRRENSPKRSASAVSNGAPAQSANRPAPAPQLVATEKLQQPVAATPESAATEKPVPATSLGPEAENSMPPVQTLDNQTTQPRTWRRRHRLRRPKKPNGPASVCVLFSTSSSRRCASLRLLLQKGPRGRSGTPSRHAGGRLGPEPRRHEDGLGRRAPLNLRLRAA
jgi:hypothetical protein